MDVETADGKYGKCTKEYLPHPPHTWPIWVVDGRYAIFSCLDGYSYESQNQRIVLCDQDTEQWESFNEECAELTQPVVEVGSTTPTMTGTSQISPEQSAELPSAIGEDWLSSTEMNPKESPVMLNTVTFTSNWSSTILSTLRQELSPVTELDNQITNRTKQETESPTSETEPTGSLGPIFTDEKASRVSSRQLDPDIVSPVTLAEVGDQSSELSVSSNSEDDTFLNSQTISVTSTTNITDYVTRYDFGPLPLILGVLFVIVTLAVIIVLVVILRRKKYRRKRNEHLCNSESRGIYNNYSVTCIDKQNNEENKATAQASNMCYAVPAAAKELSISDYSNEINEGPSVATLSSSSLDVNGSEETEDDTSTIDNIYPGCVTLRMSGVPPYSDTSTRL